MWPQVADELMHAGGISDIAVMQVQIAPWQMVVMMEVIDPGAVEGARSPYQPVNLIALIEELLGHIGAVLACHTRDECSLVHHTYLPVESLRVLAALLGPIGSKGEGDMVVQETTSNRDVVALRLLFERFSRILCKIPRPALAALLAIAALVRTGIYFTPPTQTPADMAAAFPTVPPTSEALSLGWRGLIWLLQIRELDTYYAASTVLAALVLVASAYVFLQLTSRRALGIVLASVIILGPFGATVLTTVGRSDILVLAGGICLGLSRGKIPLAIAGAMLMVAGNPEQALVAATAYCITCAGLRQRSWLRASLLTLPITGVGFATLYLFARSAGAESRLEYLPRYAKESLLTFAQNLPLQLYAGYGLACIAFLIVLLGLSGRFAALVAFGAVVIPLLATAFTLDQTRVLVGVSTAAVVAVSWVTLETIDQGQSLPQWMPGAALGAGILLPGVVIAYPGTVVVPFEHLIWFLQTGLLPGS